MDRPTVHRHQNYQKAKTFNENYNTDKLKGCKIKNQQWV